MQSFKNDPPSIISTSTGSKDNTLILTDKLIRRMFSLTSWRHPWQCRCFMYGNNKEPSCVLMMW